MHARAYLRASQSNRTPSRAREQIEAFAGERSLPIVGTYVENEFGAKLARPELFRLIGDSQPGDVLLIEQVDRLSRLTDADWRKLRAELDAKQIRVVAMDLADSWQLAATADDFTSRMFAAINGCCSTCSPPWRAKTTRTAAAGRRKGSPRRSSKARTAGVPKIPIATLALLRCCAPVRHGRQFRARSGAAGPRSPRWRSGRLRSSG